MNRQRTNIRSRYYRCLSAPAPAPAPVRRRPARAVGLLVDLLPGALTAFTGLGMVAAGIVLH